MAGERDFLTLNFPAQVKSISSDCLSQVVTTSGQYSTNSNGNPYVFQCVLEEGYILSNVSFENNEGCSLRGFTDNTFTLDAELPHGINGSVNISVAEIQKSVSSKNLARFLEKCDERYAKAGEGGGANVVDLGEFTGSTMTDGSFKTTVTVDTELLNALWAADAVSFTLSMSMEGVTISQKISIPITSKMEMMGIKSIEAVGVVQTSGGDDLEFYDHGYTICRFRQGSTETEFGLIVYPMEDNPRTKMPYPYSYDAGKVPVVRTDGTGYELQDGIAKMYKHHIYILDEDRYLELISTSTIGVKNFSELKDEEIVIVKVITDMGQTPVFPVVAYRILSEDQQVEIYYINSGTYDMLSFSFDMAVEDSVVPL